MAELRFWINIRTFVSFADEEYKESLTVAIPGSISKVMLIQ
jgi:hypothetical protein